MAQYKQIDDKKIKQLHQVQLEILDAIVAVCQKHNISYQLSGGTLLGAIRHKGFIPWDDDVDLTMLREDYDKFIKVAQNEFGDKYFLQCYETDDCYFPFIKVRKNNTVFDEEEIKHLDCHKGIFIDIFPFERINNPDSKKLKIKAILVKNIWDTIFVKKGVYSNYRKTRHPLLCRLLAIFSYNYLKKWQIKLMKSVNAPDGQYLCALCGAYSYRKDIHKFSEMMPISDVVFENKTYTTYNNPDHYLTNLYGEYMVLPPMDKRVNHAPEKIIFSTKNDK